MAGSAGKTQSSSKCQFCEESEDIRRLCYHCNLYLCQICNERIHSKLKTCQGHKIVASSEVNRKEATNTRRRVDLANMTCEDHKGEKCISFCLDCQVKLCQICYEGHGTHDKKGLQAFYDEELALILKVKQDLGENKTQMVTMDTMLTKMKDDNAIKFKKVKNDIDKREQDMIEKVQKHAKQLQKEVEHVYQSKINEIQKNLSGVQKTISHLKVKEDIVDNIINSHQSEKVLNSRKTIGDLPEPYQANAIRNTECSFTTGVSLASRVDEIFGKVYKIRELKLLNTYETKLYNVTHVISKNERENIISSLMDKKLQKIHFDNGTLTVIKEENIEVHAMALMENGDEVISTGGSELKIYKNEGTIKQYKNFFHWTTLGVHLNKRNEVLVGLSSSLFNDNASDSAAKVVVLNRSGDILHTYQYIKDREKLFTKPERISTCLDIICVVDILNDSFEGRVVSFDYGGHVQWVYKGEGERGQDEFYPTGMTLTHTDLIMITDQSSHAIHVLNSRGQAIVCHQVKDLGVENPFSICMDNEGLVWVGCKGGKLHSLTFV